MDEKVAAPAGADERHELVMCAALRHGVEAQVEIESKKLKQLIILKFQALRSKRVHRE
jgi:hypothetical protein